MMPTSASNLTSIGWKRRSTAKKWSLCAVVRTNRGSPSRKTLQLPKHDAETIKEIIESLYGEKWTLIRDGDR